MAFVCPTPAAGGMETLTPTLPGVYPPCSVYSCRRQQKCTLSYCQRELEMAVFYMQSQTGGWVQMVVTSPSTFHINVDIQLNKS